MQHNILFLTSQACHCTSATNCSRTQILNTGFTGYLVANITADYAANFMILVEYSSSALYWDNRCIASGIFSGNYLIILEKE